MRSSTKRPNPPVFRRRTPKRWPIEDGQLTANGLTSGDVNGDGRQDLLLLAESYVYVLRQTTNHGLAEPEKIPFSGVVKSLQQ